MSTTDMVSTRQYLLFSLKPSWSKLRSFYLEEPQSRYILAYDEVFDGNLPSQWFFNQLKVCWVEGNP